MRRFTALVFAVSVAFPIHAEKVSATDRAKWTVDDVIAPETATDFQFSPDGQAVVWVKTTADRDKGEMVSQLVRTDLETRRETVLTRGSESCLRPRWSPDGKYIAFTSARSASKSKAARKGKPGADEDKTQLWLIDPFGGEPWTLTELTRSVIAFDWAGDDHLIFVAQEDATLRETTRDEKKDTAVVVEDEKNEPPARLFKIAIASKKTTRLSDNGDRIESVAVSPDGRYVVAIHSCSLCYPYDSRVKPQLFLHDLECNTRRRMFDDLKLNVKEIRWSPDGKGFYAINEYSNRPMLSVGGVVELYYFDLAANAAARIDLNWDNGLASQAENDDAYGLIVGPDGFIALLANGVRPKAARYTRIEGGWRRDFLTGEHADRIFAFQAAADGKSLVYARSAADSPTRWFIAPLDGAALGKPELLVCLNEQYRKRQRARVEVVRWKGAQDEEVEGLLYYPHDHKPGVEAPLVVMIHGGPAANDQDCWDETWSYAPNLLCQRGAFVLRPNYHGSAGYGLKWLESIAGGKYLDLEPTDIEKGVDYLIARGLVDPAKLGLFGWSNGAILTNELTTRTTRYRAAVAGAGSIEYVSDWALCDFGDVFDRYYFGKSPLEDPQLYLRKSPFFRLDKVETPTLIFFGSDDRVVPAHQGWVHYRALQQLGKTDVRFVTFPGEKHGLKKLSHRRRKLEEELAWFDRNLFGLTKEEEPALKADSPLAWALKKKNAKRDGSRFGVAEKGILVPETVNFGRLQVGRFEVTRAQFAAFDAKRAVEPGRENYPANGVSFEQAQAYCAWLSKATGRTYRLPTEDEAEELYETADGNENTLDYWAGYTPNPDDAARLRLKASEMGTGSLLREVGLGRGAGTGERVFDLGGNVAEWVVGENGKSVLRGGSADRVADSKRATNMAAEEYRGFRVIFDAKANGPRAKE